ncbi:MAG: hypothetical protein ICV53_01445, partial [Flavisolibacter sp.]|nr:hypothetical protein [Flavisolibacter sp.]
LDDEVQNVVHEQKDTEGQFYFYQGSKIIRGYYSTNMLEAEVVLARMPHASVPVMRRLLEMNFRLYYTRYALSGDKLCMLFDTDIETANPNKLYYGLKELATKADKQDDLLVQDFATLLSFDVEHIAPIPDSEKETKYKYLKKWIDETLQLIQSIDQDKYSGGIAYVLLALAFRIDYLITPEGRLLLDLEKIVDVYFKKDDRSVMEKNSEMAELFQKLKARTKEEVFPYLFRSKYTFSIVMPQNYKTIADAIYNANQNISWYKENKLPQIATQISEYGFSYCQYSYSLPRPVSELFQLFMMVNYTDYFLELGFEAQYYNTKASAFNQEAINQKIESIQEKWKTKYPQLSFKTDKLKFTNMVVFNQSFTTEVEHLNMDSK